MKYKFNIWYKPSKNTVSYLETIEIEAESEKDSLDEIAQIVTDRTKIEVIHKPVTVKQVKEANLI